MKCSLSRLDHAQSLAGDSFVFKYGQGRVVMTTFRLGSTVGLDPIGTAMFRDLVDHLQSEDCRPTLGDDQDHLRTAISGGT
jgi:hypothetical protein